MKYLFTLITLLFIGCGETPEQDNAQVAPSTVIDMQINKSYSVSTGDRVDNASSDAEVKVVKNIEGETTNVTLILGSAQLIRKN